MFPETVRAALAVDCLRALGKTRHPSATAVIDVVRGRFPGNADVGTAADEAVTALGAPAGE
jgi:hypothetical protein